MAVKKGPLPRTVSVRVSDAEHTKLKQMAGEAGFRSVGAYLQDLHRQNVLRRTAVTKKAVTYPTPKIAYKKRRGVVYQGDSRGLMKKTLKPKSVDLIVTSPPFGLVRQKAYKNEDADQYVEWFRPFAEGMRRILKPHGSLVIDIGGAWRKGQPSRSLYHFKLLTSLCEDFGFHLCQEHYWWNPAKLPAPAEWVNIRRIRVKDAVNCLWWLSLSPWPRANNKRVLVPYSESMEKLLKDG